MAYLLWNAALYRKYSSGLDANKNYADAYDPYDARKSYAMRITRFGTNPYGDGVALWLQ